MKQEITKNLDLRPWPGLSSYSVNHAKYFHGRYKEIIEIINQITTEPLCCLFGPSGVGKTSILQAGLGPQISEYGFFPVFIRLNHIENSLTYSQQVIQTLRETIKNENIDIEELTFPIIEGSNESLWEFFHRHIFWNTRNYQLKPILILDQFEEIFTLSSSKSNTVKFITELGELAENSVPLGVQSYLKETNRRIGFPIQGQDYRVLISLREDFLGQLEIFTKNIPVFRRNKYAIKELDGQQGLEAICIPGEKILDKSIAISIIDSITIKNRRSGEPIELKDRVVEPSILSLFCSELNEERIKLEKEKITIEQVKNQGENIIQNFYNKCLNKVSTNTIDFIEKNLLTTSGYRNAVALEDISDGQIQNEINELIKSRVLHVEERQEMLWVEFSHDILAKVAFETKKIRKTEKEFEIERKELEELKQNGLNQRKILVGMDLLIISILFFFSFRDFNNHLISDIPFFGFIAYLFLLRINLSFLMLKNEKKGFLATLIFLSFFLVSLIPSFRYNEFSTRYLLFAPSIFSNGINGFISVYVWHSSYILNSITSIIGFIVYIFPLLFYIIQLKGWKNRKSEATWVNVFGFTIIRKVPNRSFYVRLVGVWIIMVIALLIGLNTFRFSFMGIPLSFIAYFILLRHFTKNLKVTKKQIAVLLVFVLILSTVIWYSQFLTTTKVLVYIITFALTLIITGYILKKYSTDSILLKSSKAVITVFLSFVIIPALSFGYNIYTLTNYGRISNKDYQAIAFYTIKDENNKLGIRDRKELIIPVEYEKIVRDGLGFNVLKNGMWGFMDWPDDYRIIKPDSVPFNGMFQSEVEWAKMLLIPCKYKNILTDKMYYSTVYITDSIGIGVYDIHLKCQVIPCIFDSIKVFGAEGGNTLDYYLAWEKGERDSISYKSLARDNKIISLRKSLVTNNKDTTSYFELGNLYFEAGDYDNAIQVFQKAISLKHDCAEAYFNIGNSYYNKYEYNKSIEAYQKAIKLNPNYFDAYYRKGYTYQNIGIYYKAIMALTEGIFREENEREENENMYMPQSLAYAYGNLSFNYLFTKDYVNAEEAANKSLGEQYEDEAGNKSWGNENVEWVISNLALAILFQGKTKEAMKIYQSYKNKPYPLDTLKTYGYYFLNDLKELEKAGITCSGVNEARKILNN